MGARNHVVIAGAAGLAVFFGAGAFYHFQQRATQGAGEQKRREEAVVGLDVPPKCLDFGEVWEETRFKWALSIQNRSASEVKIDGFGSSCSCTDISPKSLAIPGGGSAEVQLTIDLTVGKRQQERPGQVEEFAVTIWPLRKADGSRPQPEWQVKGKVRRLSQLSERSVDFGKQSDGTVPISARHVTIAACAVPARLSVDSSAAWCAVEAKEAGAGLDLAIRPQGRLPAGLHCADIAVTAHFPDGKALRAASLPVRLEIVPDIQATPAHIHFGSREKGYTCSEAVAIRSLTGGSFQILGHRVEGINAAVRPADSQKAGVAPVFLVAPEIAGVGKNSGKVLFSVQAQDGRKSEIEVPITYYGSSAK